MNYRHSFHAGNFADVFKHAILTRVLVYLMRKPASLRFIDTHAGSGRYDLTGGDAERTGEWRDGIGRLDAATLDKRASDLLAPYLAIAGEATTTGVYPGSPALALALLRPVDRMLFCDLHPDAVSDLKACIARDRRAKAVALDGYLSLNAFLPPVERRGVVLLDPPFEKGDEFNRLADALVAGWRKWREGVFIAWYPIKDRRGVDHLAHRLRDAGPRALRMELQVDDPARAPRLVSNGLIVINPPFVLEDEATCLLAALSRQLAVGQSGYRLDWIEPAE